MTVIHLQLIGGLGNQLYQYAYVLQLSATLGAEISVDSSRLRPSTHSHEINYISLLFPETIKSSYFVSSLFNIFDIVAAGPARFLPVHDIYLTDNLLFPRRRSLCYFARGYWQNINLLSAYCDSILHKIATAAIHYASKHNFNHAGINRTCALHVRRGDYCSDLVAKQRHGVLSASFYIKAAMYISSLLGISQFHIFSDDQEWADIHVTRAICEFSSAITLGSGNAIEDFCFMSAHPVIVTSNSSFSWWAGLISSLNNGSVVVPSQWMVSRPLRQTMALKNWMVFDSIWDM